MGGIIPSGGDVRKLGGGSKNHDDGGDGTSKGGGTPCHGWDGPRPRTVNRRRIERSVEVKHGDVDDPYAVEIDKKMPKRTFLIIGLEEGAITVNLRKPHKTLRRRKVHQSSLSTS
jgi:hypothetical protein